MSFAYSQQPVLQGLTLEIQKGETVLLVGANGSGKSTLLALLAGLLLPSQGTVEVAGYTCPGQARAVRKQCALLFQDSDLQILGQEVQEDLLLGLTKEAERQRALELAWIFDLQALLARPVQTLSGGQKRKLCLAGLLARRPKVLLFDEPMSGLDYPAIKELRTIIKENKQMGVTQVIATHDLEPVIDLAGKLLLLDQGVVKGFGPVGDHLDQVLDVGVRPPCSWQIQRQIRSWEDLCSDMPSPV